MGGLTAQGQPSGTVPKATHTTYGAGLPPEWKVVGTGRFTEDEQVDLLLQNRQNGDVVVWEMNGFFRQASRFLTDLVGDPNYWVAATGDFNRDGVTDIVWRHQTEQRCVAYWLMRINAGGPPSRLQNRQRLRRRGAGRVQLAGWITEVGS